MAKNTVTPLLPFQKSRWKSHEGIRGSNDAPAARMRPERWRSTTATIESPRRISTPSNRVIVPGKL